MPSRNATQPRDPPPSNGKGPKGPEVRIGAGGGQNEAGAQRDRDVRGGTGEGGGGVGRGGGKAQNPWVGTPKDPPQKKGGNGGGWSRDPRRSADAAAAALPTQCGTAALRSCARGRNPATTGRRGRTGGGGSGRVKENPEPQNPRGTPNRERHGARRDPDGPITALQPPPPLERWSRRRHRPTALQPHSPAAPQVRHPATLQP